MGFVLTVAYIVITILSPEQFGPQWSSYHALAYLAGIIFVVSLPDIFSGRQLRSSVQTFLMLGLTAAIALSAVANGWIGGIIANWQAFLPSAAVFFFIVANVNTSRRLKIVALAAVASCGVLVVEALFGYYGGFHGDMFVFRQNLYLHDEVVSQIKRLRGAGFLNDPNDFAQMLLIALPLIFIASDKRRGVANLAIVLVPSALLLWAVYLTHSRGALIGVAALALMLARKKIGNTASVILAAALVLGMLALDFTAGRGISAVEGADRIEAWASGLEMFKTAPILGVGFGNFTDHNDITAHNSFVLCLAELGLVGSTIWVALLVTSMTGLNRIIRQQAKPMMETASAGNEFLVKDGSFLEAAPLSCESSSATGIATLSAVNVEPRVEPMLEAIVPKRWVEIFRLALVSFMTTGWFLSRSYNTPLFLVLGLATATIALERGASRSRDHSNWVSYTIAAEAAALTLVYGIVRLQF
jgi:putative inorganic carbon (HCO3(-)) transporter